MASLAASADLRAAGVHSVQVGRQQSGHTFVMHSRHGTRRLLPGGPTLLCPFLPSTCFPTCSTATLMSMHIYMLEQHLNTATNIPAPRWSAAVSACPHNIKTSLSCPTPPLLRPAAGARRRRGCCSATWRPPVSPATHPACRRAAAAGGAAAGLCRSAAGGGRRAAVPHNRLQLSRLRQGVAAWAERREVRHVMQASLTMRSRLLWMPLSFRPERLPLLLVAAAGGRPRPRRMHPCPGLPYLPADL